MASPRWQRLLTDFLARNGQPLVVILGPTAGGKTALSLEVATFLEGQGMDAEIVNADSRQLYRGLDIGTAKIPLPERRRVPHHLLDVLSPQEEATAGWYQRQAEGAIEGIRGRGAVPLLVGGSMLYVSTVIDALTLGPPADPAVRERLSAVYDRDGGAVLHRRLAEVDPVSAAAIDWRNKPYVLRALEIHELLASPKSHVVPRGELRSGHSAPEHARDLLILGVAPPREELYRRIDARTGQMFKAGWIAEVRRLLAEGCTAEDPAMKSHGYREVIRFLRSGAPASVAELVSQIAAKTRRYARRQLSWWRGDPRIIWL